MEITLKDNTYELDLGIGFALALDKQYKMKQSILEIDLEFGVGVAMLVSKLEGNSIDGILEFFEKGLKDVKTVSYSQKDLQKAVEKKAIEAKGFANLAEECIEAIQQVGLYNHIFEGSEELREEIEKYLVDSEKSKDKK